MTTETRGLPFAPGPWTLFEESETRFAVVDRDRMTIFEIDFPLGFTERRIASTARLIEAAPDLCAALEALLESGKHEGDCDNAGRAERLPCLMHLATARGRERRARTALAKAHGEEVPA